MAECNLLVNSSVMEYSPQLSKSSVIALVSLSERAGAVGITQFVLDFARNFPPSGHITELP
jgi:hypothetical protein